MQFLDHPILLALVAVLSWPVYTNLAKIFFGAYYEDLGQALRYLLQFDFVSLIKGKYLEDWDATFKFHVFLFFCIGWVMAITELVCRAFF